MRSLGFAMAGILLAAGTAGAERSRTPAETEMRRAELAVRLAALAEDEVRLRQELARLGRRFLEASDRDGRESLAQARAQVAAGLAALTAERVILSAEADHLAGIVTRTATGPLTPADPPGLSPVQIAGQEAGSTGQVAAGTAFNPAITLIPDGLYHNDNRGGMVGEIIRGADGFRTPGSTADGRGPPRGFSLRETELTFSGAVDPYFDVWGTFGIADDAIEVEEVYVQTRRFLPGLQVRFGRFFSGIGYLNRQHRHQWDFVDQALPYAALFGENLAETGVQVTWLPPVGVYAQVGFEALQGENGLIANQLSGLYPDLLQETPGPRLFTGFLKVSPDLGYSHTLQAGVSVGRSRSHQEVENQVESDVRDGTTWFLGTDLVWRYDSNRQYGQGDLTVQGEYLYRVKTFDALHPDPRASRQDGLYAQAVYGVGPRWTVGARAEIIGLRNEIQRARQSFDVPASTRYSANMTFNPTEFSRLRIQYNRGRVSNGSVVRFDQVFVQFQMSLGVHGAHQF